MNGFVSNNNNYTYGNYSPTYSDYQDYYSVGTQNNSDDLYGFVSNNNNYTYGNYSPMYYDYQDNNSLGTKNNSDDFLSFLEKWVSPYGSPAFDFERPIYLYLWPILVAIITPVNVLVIWVLLKKKMRSVTNMILVVIAISDSMTGLVTLPTYIMVFQSQDMLPYFKRLVNYASDNYASDNYENDSSPYVNDKAILADATIYLNEFPYDTIYVLSESLYNAFLISMNFISASFHTTSIWLTAYLGVQRYISVAYPFKKKVFLTTRNNLIVCIAIFVSAPFLQLYSLIKIVQGYSPGQLEEGCDGICVHIWFILLFQHLFPCAILTTTTMLFIRHLRKNSFNSANASKSIRKHTRSSDAKGDDKTRRATMIVIAVVIGLLIPELPCVIYLIYYNILHQTNTTHLIVPKHEFAFAASYKIVLVLTFHLNFYILTVFNARFRKQLLKTCSFFTSRLDCSR